MIPKPVDSSMAYWQIHARLACAALGRRRRVDPCWRLDNRLADNTGAVAAVEELTRHDVVDTDAVRVPLLPLRYRAVNRKSHTRKSLEIVWALDEKWCCCLLRATSF